MNHQHIDFNTINQALLPKLDGLLSAWLPDGHKEGKEYVALNPLRADHSYGSFRINRITGRWGDFATGNHGGDIISLYAYLNRIGQSEAARRLLLPHDYPKVAARACVSPNIPRPNAKHTIAAILRGCRPAYGTPVQTYLCGRGIDCAIPDTLLFHSCLRHSHSDTMWPGMVTLITRWPGSEPIALHRTYLAHDGNGKAPLMPNKMMIGSVSGSAARFGTVGTRLAIAEGIESALSVYQSTGLPVWAALSASNMRGLVLPPPDIVQEIIIAADHDSAGLNAAYESAEKWQAQGRRVKIALPPEGQDFNDMLKAGSL